jgi:hypothetical protein
MILSEVNQMKNLIMMTLNSTYIKNQDMMTKPTNKRLEASLEKFLGAIIGSYGIKL